VKLLAIALISFSTHCVAKDNITIDIPFNLKDNLVRAPQTRDASTIFGEHVLQSYSAENMFICGTTFELTPDDELKHAYESGLITIVSEFYATGYVESFTPIRQLLVNPVRNALYNGYYFVSYNH